MSSVNVINNIKKIVIPMKNKMGEKYSQLRYISSHREVDVRTEENTSLRINIIVPNINEKEVFGGVTTAIKFFVACYKTLGCDARIISMNKIVDVSKCVPEEFLLNENNGKTIESINIDNSNITIRSKDVFIATYWTTALVISQFLEYQKRTFGMNSSILLYLIQDYEPGFYPWSTEYAESERTYRLPYDTIALINSKELYDFMNNKNYDFYKKAYFEPVLNENLKKQLLIEENSLKRIKQILIYGRPQEHRNAFTLVVDSLRKLSELLGDEAGEWKVISLGAKHKNIKLQNGMEIVSYGKVSLQEYAKIMKESYMGISLMISPHPSYPPLEMSTFGVRTITNTFENKNLESFNDNIISMKNYDAKSIADEAKILIDEYEKSNCSICIESSYVTSDGKFNSIVKMVCDEIKVRNVIE